MCQTVSNITSVATNSKAVIICYHQNFTFYQMPCMSLILCTFLCIIIHYYCPLNWIPRSSLSLTVQCREKHGTSHNPRPLTCDWHAAWSWLELHGDPSCQDLFTYAIVHLRNLSERHILHCLLSETHCAACWTCCLYQSAFLNTTPH